MFAGPNGSGKSTLKAVLPKVLLGIYLNPDEIEQEIRRQGFLDLNTYDVNTTAAEVLPFFTGSTFLISAGYEHQAGQLVFEAGRLVFGNVPVNSYFASVAADFLRQKLLEQKTSFTLETVMSHRSKVDLLEQAQRLGYRTYLYFVATDDPAINISRVRNRVSLGGHAVPEDKIEERYHRSLNLLRDAIRHSHRAYIFDNSTDAQNHNHIWLAEITDGQMLELKTSEIPAWFKQAVLDKAGNKPESL
jgi:predicted ABC-type ATPase